MNTELRECCRALLFDLDGVLADSTASVEKHWRHWAEVNHMDADWLLQRVHGRRAVDTLRDVAPQLDAEAEAGKLILAEAGDTAGVVAAPGAGAFLAHLPSEAWAVVTSGVTEVALARLHVCHLPLPPLLIPADLVAHGKPDPEGYLLGAKRLNVDPADCIVFEDAPAGIAAAKSAGMRCIALTTTHGAEAVGAADWSVGSLAELTVEFTRDAAGLVQFEVRTNR